MKKLLQRLFKVTLTNFDKHRKTIYILKEGEKGGWLYNPDVRANATFEWDEIKDSFIPFLTLLERNPDMESAFWIYSIFVDRKSDFMRYMKECGIAVSQVHERNDIHTCVKEYRSLFPNLDKTIGRVISIPIGWWLSEEDKKQEDSRSEKASEIAQTTELSKIEDQLTKSYSNLVGISNRISDFVKDNGEEEITRDSQTNPAVLTNVIKDFFGSEETVYGDLERVQQIASTNELPENISKINGDHPLAKAYNTALEKYVVLNKAIQTNTDPLSEEQEDLLGSAGQAILEKIDMTKLFLV